MQGNEVKDASFKPKPIPSPPPTRCMFWTPDFHPRHGARSQQGVASVTRRDMQHQLKAPRLPGHSTTPKMKNTGSTRVWSLQTEPSMTENLSTALPGACEHRRGHMPLIRVSHGARNPIEVSDAGSESQNRRPLSFRNVGEIIVSAYGGWDAVPEGRSGTTGVRCGPARACTFVPSTRFATFHRPFRSAFLARPRQRRRPRLSRSNELLN